MADRVEKVLVAGVQEARRLLPDHHEPGAVFMGAAMDRAEFVDGAKWVREENAG